MNKKLEELIPDNPLDCLKALRKSANTYCSFNNAQCEYNKALADNIEQALQRLEAIDNVNPNEALNYLDQFINEMTKCLENPKQYAKDYDKEIFYKYKYTFETTIKQALIKSQEQEKENAEYKKVLKIMFEKSVDVFRLKKLDFNTFNQLQKSCGLPQLTHEEFELLKRYFR